MERLLGSTADTGFTPRTFRSYEEGDYYGLILKGEAISAGAQKLCVPFEYLIGTQVAEEYSSNKGKRAEKSIRNGGLSYLLQNPIIVTAIFRSDRNDFYQEAGDLSLYIEDGHHRANKTIKLAEELGINFVPSLVLTAEQMAQVLKNMGKIPKSPGEIASELLSQSFASRESLEMRNVRKFGRSLIGIKNMDQLSAIFTSF